MWIDAINNEYDIAYLISSDSDYTPLVRLLINQFHKDIRVIFPPRQFCLDINNLVSDTFVLDEKHLKSCQFPENVISKTGEIFRKSNKWK